jgi:hypothetical protein
MFKVHIDVLMSIFMLMNTNMDMNMRTNTNMPLCIFMCKCMDIYKDMDTVMDMVMGLNLTTNNFEQVRKKCYEKKCLNFFCMRDSEKVLSEKPTFDAICNLT